MTKFETGNRVGDEARIAQIWEIVALNAVDIFAQTPLLLPEEARSPRGLLERSPISLGSSGIQMLITSASCSSSGKPLMEPQWHRVVTGLHGRSATQCGDHSSCAFGNSNRI